jgi:hypothetical protein
VSPPEDTPSRAAEMPNLGGDRVEWFDCEFEFWLGFWFGGKF